MVMDLTYEVKSSSYKMISIVQEAPPQEAAKKEPKVPKETLNLERLTCPKCKTQLLRKGNTAYGCTQFQTCGFKIPFEIWGKKLTDKQIADLVLKGKTGKIKGLQLPGAAAATEGRIQLDEQGNLVPG